MFISRFIIFTVIFYFLYLIIKAAIGFFRSVSTQHKNDVKGGSNENENKGKYIDKSKAEEIDYEDIK